MKKYILSLAIMMVALKSIIAQQVPLFSQYHYSMFIYNPAVVGTYNRPQLYLINRNQWTDIPDAPVTRVLTFETSLSKDIVGLGGYITQDNFGVFHNTNGQLDYSYKVKLGDSTNLYLGLGAGFTNIQLEFDKLYMHDKYDPILLAQPTNRLNFDGIGGLSVNWKRLNVGMSVPQLFNTAAKFSTSTRNATVLYRTVRHFIGTVDYTFKMKNGVTLKPIYVIKKGGKATPFQHELTTVLAFKNTYWASLAYRTEWGVTAGVGIRLLDQLTLGYAYDFSTTELNNYAGQTHEVIVGYRFGKEMDKVNRRLNKLDSANIRQDSALFSLDTTVKHIMKADSTRDTLIRKTFAVLSNDLKRARMEMMDTVYRSKFRVGDRFTLTRVYFKTNSFDLLPGSKIELNDLINVLNRYPMLEIEIIGNTDDIAGEELNYTLSKNRALSVQDFLIGNGISKDRLRIRGAGKEDFIAPNDNELGKQLNRRVEFRITRM